MQLSQMQGSFKKEKSGTLEPVDTSMNKGANRRLCKDRNSRESKRRWQGYFSNRGEDRQEATRQQPDQITH